MALSALVARSTRNGLHYLAKPSARRDWVTEASDAETFANVREATRAALFLPGKLRAFALPVASAA
ncbi:MAG TPA: hypothetical protein VMT68_00495 [Caulobacteraceae bacterium]|nr:hypothetical protein [Caulobacteraceae bacterium]